MEKKAIKELKAALALVQSVVLTRSSLPILACVKISDGMIEATDLEQHLAIAVPGLEIDGEVCVNLKSLKKVVASLKDNINFSLGEFDTLIINGSIRLAGFSPKEFPAFPTCENWRKKAQFVVPENWDTLIPAINPNETRFSLCGLAVDFRNGTLIASDGHRLHSATFANAFFDLEFLPIIPFDTAHTVSKLGPGTLGTFYSHIEKADTHTVCFRSDNAELWSKLPDEKYPNYQQVIPEVGEDSQAITISRAALISAVKTCLAVASKEKTALCLHRTEQGLRIALDSWSEQGAAEQTLPATGGKDGGYIGLNGCYLLDLLEACKGEEITLIIKGWDRPMLVKEGDFTGVIMPLRLFNPPQVKEEEQLAA